MRRLILPMTFLVALTTNALPQPASIGLPQGNAVGVSIAQADSATGVLPQNRQAIAAALPAPNSPTTEQPSDLLRAAEGALAAGRGAEAENALAMAQTRLLDRSVALGETRNPSDNPAVGQISQAMQALAGHDRATCMQMIEAAIGSATAQGL